MPLLVHITPENKAKAIRRHGIAARRTRPGPEDHPEFDRIVWAFPVLLCYVLTHSWARESNKWARRGTSPPPPAFDRIDCNALPPRPCWLQSQC
ncbi:MAG: hypothetical protein HC850_17875 [Rhodomicrobium sp.]|nr:hypothetical protein [Rhodomicrobium sp.]